MNNNISFENQLHFFNFTHSEFVVSEDEIQHTWSKMVVDGSDLQTYYIDIVLNNGCFDMHIDNEDHETILYKEVLSFYDVNKCLECLDISVRFNYGDNNEINFETLVNDYEFYYFCPGVIRKETHKLNGCSVCLEISKHGNKFDRNYSLHIDDHRFETIGNIDIQTIDQFNRAMELFDIDLNI